jgi:hypothetical protein
MRFAGLAMDVRFAIRQLARSGLRPSSGALLGIGASRPASMRVRAADAFGAGPEAIVLPGSGAGPR